MDQIQETAHPLSAAAAPVANYDIQPVVKMLPQIDKRLRYLEEQVCSQCLLYTRILFFIAMESILF